MPDSDTTAPTERSNSASDITYVAPRATIARSDICWVMLMRFEVLAKESTDSAENSATMAIRPTRVP